jgi:predicted pyridoxine 5'-phosphate oxidase superfamily flavin-nucleotide-binding protein
MTTSVPPLSQEGVDQLLNSRFVVARLATTSKNGRPHVVPVWFLYVNDKICVPTPRKTLKAKNILRTPYASITIDAFKGVLDAKGILIEGPASLVTGSQSTRINIRVHVKYVGRNRLKQRNWKEFAAEDDGTIVIQPIKWRSWDFTKLKL